MKQFIYTLLCVDDDVDNCDMVQFMFETNGYKVVSCYVPEEAITFAPYENFDAIILDYLMPGLNGMEICRAIRSFDETIPIIFFTAVAQKHHRTAMLDAGATACLIKPNDLEILTETVSRLIERRAIV
jgi:CheY-like chemotaxis protein